MQTRKCNEHFCPVDCVFGVFSEWSKCDAECAGGLQERFREIKEPKHGGKECPLSVERRDCNKQACPIDCQLSDYGPFDVCSRTCGSGSQTKRRTVLVAPQHGGRTCLQSPSYKEWTLLLKSTLAENDGDITTVAHITSHSNGDFTTSRPHGTIDQAEFHSALTSADMTQKKIIALRIVSGKNEQTFGPFPDGLDASAFANPCTDCNCLGKPLGHDLFWHGGMGGCFGSPHFGISFQSHFDGSNGSGGDPHMGCNDGNGDKASEGVNSKWADSRTSQHYGHFHKNEVNTGGYSFGQTCTNLEGSVSFEYYVMFAPTEEPIAPITVTETCNSHECPIDCVSSPFQEWSTCSKACGNGVSKRSRTILIPEAHGGQKCPDGPNDEEKPCNTHACPIDCEVTEWTPFGECTQECGTGMMKRTRTVKVTDEHGGSTCPNLEDTRDCNVHHCPVHCITESWTDYSTCTKTCGGGEQTRSRGVIVEENHGGDGCGDLLQTRSCNQHSCSVDCVVSDFSHWSACSATCGGGSQLRSRLMTTEPLHGGKVCPSLVETKDCNEHHCPLDCKFSDFEDWSDCSLACGGGESTRAREISIEAAYHGKECVGELTEKKTCNIQNCPIDCVSNPPSEWDTCTEFCGGGTQKRTHVVTTKYEFGGKKCYFQNQEEDVDSTTPGQQATSCNEVGNCVESRGCNMQACTDKSTKPENWYLNDQTKFHSFASNLKKNILRNPVQDVDTSFARTDIIQSKRDAVNALAAKYDCRSSTGDLFTTVNNILENNKEEQDQVDETCVEHQNIVSNGLSAVQISHDNEIANMVHTEQAREITAINNAEQDYTQLLSTWCIAQDFAEDCLDKYGAKVVVEKFEKDNAETAFDTSKRDYDRAREEWTASNQAYLSAGLPAFLEQTVKEKARLTTVKDAAMTASLAAFTSSMALATSTHLAVNAECLRINTERVAHINSDRVLMSKMSQLVTKINFCDKTFAAIPDKATTTNTDVTTDTTTDTTSFLEVHSAATASLRTECAASKKTMTSLLELKKVVPSGSYNDLVNRIAVEETHARDEKIKCDAASQKDFDDASKLATDTHTTAQNVAVSHFDNGVTDASRLLTDYKFKETERLSGLENGCCNADVETSKVAIHTANGAVLVAKTNAFDAKVMIGLQTLTLGRSEKLTRIADAKEFKATTISTHTTAFGTIRDDKVSQLEELRRSSGVYCHEANANLAAEKQLCDQLKSKLSQTNSADGGVFFRVNNAKEVEDAKILSDFPREVEDPPLPLLSDFPDESKLEDGPTTTVDGPTQLLRMMR
jgi:hypothetical protein